MKEGDIMDIKIELPDYVEEVLNKLMDSGYEAYVVGGAIRDSILGKEPHDYDIATNARPQQIMEVFNDGYEVVPTGLQHGTVTVVINHIPIEITTYRCDGKYSDGRHPDDVSFVDTIKEDLSRRDFTINAMAYNHKDGLVDPFNGLEDMKHGLIRCVGNPAARFGEDALRIMRAIRFACQLNYNIAPYTSIQIHNMCDNLKNISIERICNEFCTIARTDIFSQVLDIYTDVFLVFIPEIKDMIGLEQNNPWHIYDVYGHTYNAVENCDSNSLITKLAVFFHDIGKPYCYQDEEDSIRHFKGHPKVSAEMTDKIMRRMKFSNEVRGKVVELVSYHDAEIKPGCKYIKRWLNKIGEEQFRRLLDVQRADALAQNLELSQYKIDNIEIIKEELEKVIAEQQCFSLKDLAINGKYLIDNGFKEGKIIGEILNKLLKEVIDGKIENDKDILLNRSLSMMIRAKE